ncbi:MAG: hypothetical protein E7K02_12685, partial [Staphylococcus epidermidis]|nr:hypothetical protein [Staphylococcus epidermidis]
SLYDSRNPLARIYSVINKDIKNGMIPDKIIEHRIMLNNGREERHIIEIYIELNSSPHSFLTSYKIKNINFFLQLKVDY